MNEYRHILVAFDGSDDSKSALETAEYIAKFSDAHLTVAYVHEPSTDAFAHAITAQPGNTNYYQSPLTGDLVPTPMQILDSPIQTNRTIHQIMLFPKHGYSSLI
ncbi:universal stress protein [Paracerasibacillus soli]|uniref:Universal stress protein n=1 Tax=Paracerasibacillus soli TaxID=480284 RepID=A0ABU5CU45_9BACI|nr:universal stress protein [Virgibacillus soli]MDY0409745.1 universal stress protein [Virgibacillus soli]